MYDIKLFMMEFLIIGLSLEKGLLSKMIDVCLVKVRIIFSFFWFFFDNFLIFFFGLSCILFKSL